MNAPSRAGARRAVGAAVLLSIFVGGWYVLSRQDELRRREQSVVAQQQLALEAITLYENAKRAGHKVDACLYAGRAAAAFARAEDDARFAVWQKTETQQWKTLAFPF